MPKWLTFLVTMAASHGLVSLGIVLLMRGGVVSFGQGLVFATGAYAAALGFNKLGITDAAGLALLGGAAATLIAAPFAPLLSRYRGIFFAMLTLALSMVAYGALVKTEALGGSDGFNMGRPTLFGQSLPDARVGYVMYSVTVTIAALLALLARIYFDSTRGLVSLATRDNELRVEYMGATVRATVHLHYVISAVLAGIGGALMAINIGHIDPEMTYWPQSGEFVFIAILSGTGNVFAPLAGALAFETIRSFAYEYSPNTWQMVLGVTMLVVMIFLPGGLWSLFVRKKPA
jgi:branched-chain amino acid transport system permease protein